MNFIANDRNGPLERAVSRKVMWDWDNGKVQRQQKKHVRQAELFGWSVRGWWWDVDEYQRKRGIDISDPMAIAPTDLELIAKTYQVPDPAMLQNPEVLANLQRQFGKRGLLDVRYTYKAYEGPRSRVLFIGDCFPEPFFDSIQESSYFIIERRRNRDWLIKLGKRFQECQAGVMKLLEMYPNGTEIGAGANRDYTYLRDNMRAAIGYATTSETRALEQTTGSNTWAILERWTPGEKSYVDYVGEETIHIGRLRSPYDLDGKIPFTELILIDEIMGGVGDSVARITRGLQQMHNVATNRRFDLYRHVSQPLMFTSSREYYDNPGLLRRDNMRLVFSRGGPASVWTMNESQAMAAMAASMSEESAQQRMFQMAGGDSNMSMAANVDPAQLRTATGARMLQANQDVLTKDLVDQFGTTSVQCDAEMIYLFNRSEMADAVRIDPVPYERNYTPNRDPRELEWIQAEPIHFQVDGKLVVRLGSTLADDDEANVAKATNLFQMLSNHPNINQEKLAQDLLIAHGKGPELQSYMQQQQPGPPPIKASVSFSVDAEKLSSAEQRVLLQQAGIEPEAVQQAQQQVEQEIAQSNGMPPMAPEPSMLEGAPPEIDPTNLLNAMPEGASRAGTM